MRPRWSASTTAFRSRCAISRRTGCCPTGGASSTISSGTGHQHDALSIAAWVSRADREGSLAALLNPDLSPPERTLAQVEGWILGVPGLIRTGKARDDSAASNACDPSVFRLH